MSSNYQYLTKSGITSFDGDWIATGGHHKLSLTVAWTAVTDTDGVLSIQATDFRAIGETVASTRIVTMTLAAVHGTGVTVGATAGKTIIVCTELPGFIRLHYEAAAGGAVGQFVAAYTLSD